jgi:hypothetical protein
MRELAPVLLFVYNRPYHTRQTVEALQRNFLASDSELFIYSDAAKSIKDKDKAKVQEIRDYIHAIKGFKQVKIVERENNWGLASSIVDGVTKTINKYGKVIVLEDDLVTSPCFLKFMNDALTLYENEKKVWHISGWNYPISVEDDSDVFLWRVMNCWGWATWSDRWLYYQKNVDAIIAKFDSKMIRQFDLDSSGVFWSQVLANKEGRLDTWAIFWYVAIFLRKGLCLNPSITYVQNIGLDGSGVHCSAVSDEVTSLNMNLNCQFPLTVNESLFVRERIKGYYKNKKNTLGVRLYNLYIRVKRKLVR